MAHYLENRENLVNILSTAFYGSSWFTAHTPIEFREAYKDGYDDRETRWAQILLDGGHINVDDDEEGETFALTLEKMKEAWDNEKGDKYVDRAKGHILAEEDDLYDADAIVQAAIFGEVVYG